MINQSTPRPGLRVSDLADPGERFTPISCQPIMHLNMCQQVAPTLQNAALPEHRQL
jgi:hypothetical protein